MQLSLLFTLFWLFLGGVLPVPILAEGTALESQTINGRTYPPKIYPKNSAKNTPLDLPKSEHPILRIDRSSKVFLPDSVESITAKSATYTTEDFGQEIRGHYSQTLVLYGLMYLAVLSILIL